MLSKVIAIGPIRYGILVIALARYAHSYSHCDNAPQCILRCSVVVLIIIVAKVLI